MRLVLLAALLLRPGLACAQFGSFNGDQPFLAFSATTPTWDGTIPNLPGISHWWVETNGVVLNTSLNPNRITNWSAVFGLDEVGQLAMFGSNTATVTKWPTNVTSKGIFFEGFGSSQSLVLPDNRKVTNDSSIAVAMFVESKRWSYPTIPLLAAHPQSTIASSTATRSSDSNILATARDSAGSALYAVFGPLPNTLADFVVGFSNSPSGGGAFGYLNGQLMISTNSASLTNIYSSWGVIGNAGAGYFDGWIREILLFTNVPTSETVSNIHYYRTNVYGGSP